MRNGTWANTISLSALSRAIGVELRIFAWSTEEDKWQLYVIKPRMGGHKKKSGAQVVWLVLQDYHYTWLKVVSKAFEEVLTGAMVLGHGDQIEPKVQ